jgi:hypothetical protein
MEEVETYRPSASAYMLVDSLDRYGKDWPNTTTFTTSSDWRLNSQTPVVQGFFTRLCLTQVNFQWNIPTILFNYNDLFQIGIVGTGPIATIVLDSGFYTPTTLAAEIQAKLLLAFPLITTITCVYDTQLGSFVIDSGDSTQFLILAATSGTSNTVRRRQRCLETLGFMNTSGAGSGSSKLFGNVPTMLATRFVDICSSYLTKYQKVKDGSTLISSPRQDMLCRLFAVAPNTRAPITATDSPGSTPFSILQDMNNPKFIKWSPDEAINNFDIQVRDEFGDILPVQQGFCSEYSMTFMVTES